MVALAHRHAPAFRARMDAAGLAPQDVGGVADLARLSVLHKDDLIALQRESPPFGGLLMIEVGQLRRIFQSPGPIYDPEEDEIDPWRWAAALRAAGFQPSDIVLNAFGYHLTPAGAMFEEGLGAIGCVTIPGGIGNQEQQVALMHHLRVTGYIGLPSYLNALFDKAAEQKVELFVRQAFVTAEPLPPTLRKLLQGYGLTVRQGVWHCRVRIAGL
jgi:phenylacetate-CoA ligase